MVKKRNILFKQLLIFVVVLTITLIAWLVAAATGDSIKMRDPSSGTNHSGAISGSVVLNVTYLYSNSTEVAGDLVNGSLSTANATFYINISDTQWLIIGNSSNCVTYKGVDANVSCYATLNISALNTNGTLPAGNGSLITDGFHSINATIYNGTAANILTRGIKAGNLSTILLDNTEPNIVAFNLIANVNASGTNHSNTNAGGNVTLNVTAVDALSNVSIVIFNVINSTGGVNDTIVGIAEGVSGRYSISIDTRSFPDGVYNITLFVNDTTGNFNATANDSAAELNNIRFDNTKPSPSMSCTPDPVNEGATITCSCSATDSTSGINGSATSYTTSPSTSGTGTHTTTCSVADNARNSNSVSVNYLVTGQTGGGAGGGGGGGGAVTSWTTYSVTEEDFKEGETRELKDEQRLRIEINNEDHFVGVVEVSGNRATIEISSTPQRVTLNVGETKKFEVTNDNYYDVSVTLDSITGSKAKITILSIREEIPAPAAPEPAPVEAAPEVAAAPPTEAGGTSPWSIILIVTIIIIVVAIAWYVMKKKS